MNSSRLIRSLAVLFCVGFGGQSWSQVLLSVTQNEPAVCMEEIGGQLWLGLSRGAVVVDKESMKTVRMLAGRINALAGDQEGVWLGTDDGLFIIRNENALPVLPGALSGRKITALLQSEDALWVGTTRGLLRILFHDNSLAEYLNSQSVRQIKKIGENIHIGTNKGLFEISHSRNPGGEPRPLSEEPINVAGLYEILGDVWVTTIRRAGRTGFGAPRRPKNGIFEEVRQGHEVISLAGIEGEVWFGTSGGLLLGDTEQLGIEEPVNTIEQIGDTVWIGTTRRAYKLDDGSWVPFPRPPVRMNVREIREFSGSIWIRAETGIFVVVGGASIEVSLSTKRVLGMEVLAGALEIENIEYVNAGSLAPAGSLESFGVIAEEEKEEFEKMLLREDYRPAATYDKGLSFGLRRLDLSVRDDLGNVASISERRLLVIPKVPLIVGLLAILSMFFALRRITNLFRQVTQVIEEPTTEAYSGYLGLRVTDTHGKTCDTQEDSSYLIDSSGACTLEAWFQSEKSGSFTSLQRLELEGKKVSKVEFSISVEGDAVSVRPREARVAVPASGSSPRKEFSLSFKELIDAEEVFVEIYQGTKLVSNTEISFTQIP